MVWGPSRYGVRAGIVPLSTASTDPVRIAARRSPGALAVSDSTAPATARGSPGQTLSYHELDRWVDRAAAALRRTGVSSGQPVAVRFPPCPESIALIHAVWRVGAVLLPLGSGWPDVEVERALRALGRSAVVVDELADVRRWFLGDVQPVEGVAEFPGPRAEALAAWVFTSGSTGAPAPVGITHANLAASAQAVIERLSLRTGDRWLTSLAPAHIGGLALIHRAGAVGCTLVTRPRFEAMEVASLIDAAQVTHISLVPVMLRCLIAVRGDRPPPASLRCVLVGGAATPGELLKQALDLGYPISLTYGMTEATSQVATATPNEVRRKPGSVGKPLSGVDLEIRSQADRVPDEVWVRGPTLAPGSAMVDAGWLATGDLGHLDADGDLWITGRASERIVTGGVRVEPIEIETVLEACPFAREVAVLGVPDPKWGERIVAIVVPEDADRPPSLEELLDFSRSRLAAPKRPRGLRIVSELPRTPMGKLDRARLRSLSS